MESHDDAPQLAAAAAAVFGRWQDTLATGLGNGSVPDDRAARLARLIVAAVEGATILCRAHRDVAPWTTWSANSRS